MLAHNYNYTNVELCVIGYSDFVGPYIFRIFKFLYIKLYVQMIIIADNTISLKIYFCSEEKLLKMQTNSYISLFLIVLYKQPFHVVWLVHSWYDL